MSDLAEKRKRRIRFHGRVQFKTIPHLSNYSDDEIEASWYRKEDFTRMSDDVGEIANLVAKGVDTRNGEELSIRGLEHLVEEDVADYRAEKMIESIDAVLDEQDEQRDEGVFNPDAIAQLYTEIVSPLLREAHLVGLRDEQEATAAAEQIPDTTPEEVVVKKKTKSSKRRKNKKAAPATTEFESERGEEILNSSDILTNERIPNGSNEKPEQKAQPKKKPRLVRGKPSEMSPLVRRRDGSFAFRHREFEAGKRELSKQRRDCVRDSLFKFLDSYDDIPDSGFIR